MKTRKPYAAEFKQEAVTWVTEQGMGVTHVARDVDVSVDTRHRWLRDARSVAHPGTTDAVARQEIARLRRDVAQRRMERAILKKALGIFSRMPQ